MRKLIVCLVLLCGLATGTAAPAHAAGAPSASGSQVGATSSTLALYDRLCRAIDDHYPVPEFVGWRGEWVGEFRAKVASAPTPDAAFQLMDELVCRLNDYHTRLSWPGRPRLVAPPFRVEPALKAERLPAGYGIWGRTRPPLELPALNDVAIAVVEAGTGTGLEAGDEIVAVGGEPVAEALRQAWRHAVGSTAACRLMSAADRMLQAPAGSDLKLEVRRGKDYGANGGGEILEKTVRMTSPFREDLISTREVDSVPVIRITRWSNGDGIDLTARFDELLARWKNRPALIVDVRRNGGGSDDLADAVTGRFISSPVIASFAFQRKVPTQQFDFLTFKTQPRGPWRFEGRVAVLTDGGCMSACEHFVSGMIEAGAVACGTPTNGAGGFIRGVDLGDGVRLNISETLPIHTGGIPSPNLGIAPHLWAPRTLSDLRAGRDTTLQAALAWLKSSAPPPARLQPTTPLAQ